MKKQLAFLTPLVAPILFLALLALFWNGLGRNPRLVPSPLVDKPLPSFELGRLRDPEGILRPEDFLGQVSLLNVWATDCPGCWREHGLLMAISRAGTVPLYGLNYNDGRAEALGWLDRFGDPYIASIHDPAGRLSLDLGVYGTPETFVIDPEGIIRRKHIGPLSKAVWETELLPLIRSLTGPAGEGKG